MLQFKESNKRLVAYGDMNLLKKKLEEDISQVLPRITKGKELDEIRYWQGAYEVLNKLKEILEAR